MGPATYPRVVSLLLFMFSAVQPFLSWKPKDSLEQKQSAVARQGSGQAYKYSLGTLTLKILHVGFFHQANYLVTTMGFLPALLLLGGVRKRLVLLGLALGYSLATSYVLGKTLLAPSP
jgi:hypothetical protein